MVFDLCGRNHEMETELVYLKGMGERLPQYAPLELTNTDTAQTTQQCGVGHGCRYTFPQLTVMDVLCI